MDEAGASSAASRPVVLVAEDDPSVRMAIELILEDGGFDVILAEDGERALTIARSKSPDAILLDLMMPKLDGRQVLSGLRESERTARIPVFVLSGMSGNARQDWPGAHVVGKPFDPGALVESLRGILATEGTSEPTP